jgi:hypothetical protein
MSSVKWWHSLFIAFSIASWGMAQPLYSYVTTNDLFSDKTGPTGLFFMLVYQGLPLAVLFVLDRIVVGLWGAGNVLKIFRGALFAGAVLVFLRAGELDRDIQFIDALNSLPMAALMILAVAAYVAVASIAVYFYRPANLLFLYLSAVSAVLTVVFIVQVGLVGKPWTGDTARASQPQAGAGVNQPPIFLIVFDGLDSGVLLKDGQVDDDLFPNFAGLAGDGALFTNATSNYFDSAVSIQSLVTGKFYVDDGFFQSEISGPESVGIFQILSETGYSVSIHSNHSRLVACGDDRFFLCQTKASAVVDKNIHLVARDFAISFVPRDIGLAVRDFVFRISPQKLTVSIPFPSIHQYDRPLWDGFLDGVSRTQSPGRVYLVHSMLPHHPYELDRYGDRVRFGRTDEDFDDLERLAGYYKEQIGFADTLLGELIARLKAEGLFQRSFLIVTSDHGPRSLGLGEKYDGFRVHTFFPDELSGMIPQVPLIIHGPGIPVGISQVDYQHIDYLPTLLDTLDLPVPTDLAGVSAFSPKRPTRDKVFFGYPGPTASGTEISYIYDSGFDRWLKSGRAGSIDATENP